MAGRRPEACVGDLTSDPLQHLLNSRTRLAADPHGLPRRMASLLDLDRRRLELWLFARCAFESIDTPALGPIARSLAP